MTSISTAIGSERVSRVSGYALKKGNFNNSTPNLPQQVVILAEANTANQSAILLNDDNDPLPVVLTSADDAGLKFGYGSPIHQIMRILHPISSDGIGGIPCVVMAQLAAPGSTPTVNTWNITGTATANTTHTILMNGRSSLDFKNYTVAITTGDKGDVIAAKYAAAINAVIGATVAATHPSTPGTYESASVAFNASAITAGQSVTFAGLTYSCVGTYEQASVAFAVTSLSAGQSISLGGLTYTSTGVTTQTQIAAAFANLANGAITGGGTATGTYSGQLLGWATGNVLPGVFTVVFTSTVIGPVSDLVQTGSGPAATITTTQGTNSMTQAQLAAAFASLANGATTGAGTGTGTYAGSLQGWTTGTVSSGTVIFTSTRVGNVANLVQSGSGPAATITTTPGVEPIGVLTLITKWTGGTSASLITSININGNSVGITYALTTVTAGAGTPDISGALTQFGDNWYPTVINSYGIATLDILEDFNGIPDNQTPTGRYVGDIFKPLMAFFGSTISVIDDLIAITDAAARIDQVTNVLCPAPNSAGFPWEAAANAALLFCRVMQDTPHLDINPLSYPDMPIPLTNTIGGMSDYNNRDELVKKGCSTVILKNGAYQIQDFVTTYHPEGEVPLQFSYARNLNLDWNVKFGYAALEEVNVKDHVLIQDDQITDVSKAIKPKEWKAIIFDYFDTLAQNALLKDPQFSKDSLVVVIDTDNPNRFNSKFNYKRTGISRIQSTTATVGF